MRLFDQSERSRNSFCFEALALGHTSSSLSFGETEDRFIFCIRLWFLLQYPPPPLLLWDLPEKSSPNRVVPVLGEDWGDASFFLTRVSTWARRSWQSPALTQMQSVEPWWIVWILKLIQEVRSSHFQGYETQIPRGRPLCSHCTELG